MRLQGGGHGSSPVVYGEGENLRSVHSHHRHCKREKRHADRRELDKDADGEGRSVRGVLIRMWMNEYTRSNQRGRVRVKPGRGEFSCIGHQGTTMGRGANLGVE